MGLLQTSCLHRLLVFGRRDALQIQRLNDSTVMSISMGHVGFENVNCSFGSEKSPSSAGCFSVFLELVACKPKRDNGGQKSEVVSNLYGVGGCKQ